MFTGPYLNQIKRAVWNEWNTWLEMQPQKIKTGENGTDLTIRLIDGKWLSLVGLDKYDRTRGFHPVAAVHDEVAKAKRLAFEEVVTPALRSHKGPELDITTPRGGWWKERWEEGLNPKFPDIASWKIRADEVGMISEEDLAEARATMSPAMYAQEYEAEFTNATGPIFPEFVQQAWPLGHLVPPGLIRAEMAKGGYPLGAVDWAFEGTAVLQWLWVTRAGGLIVLDEMTCTKKTPAAMMTMAKARRKLPGVIYVDYRCWGKERDGRSVADDFKRAVRGLNVAIVQADKRFDESIVKLADLMTITGDEEFPKFAIESGKAPLLQRQLRELSEEDVKPHGGGFKDSVECDCADAIRYGAMAAKPGRGPIVVDTTEKGPLWGKMPRNRAGLDTLTGFDALTGEPLFGSVSHGPIGEA